MEMPYLSFGNIHEHGEAGHMVALAADMGFVSEGELTALGGPTSCPSDPTTHTYTAYQNGLVYSTEHY